MVLNWQMLAIVRPLVFLAGFIDSVAGGGGLISLPAYLAAGLPPQLAAGSNKLSAGCGTLLATLRYARRGWTDTPPALLSAALALPASFLGAWVAMGLPEGALRAVMLGGLVPAAAALLCRKKERTDTENKRLPGPKRYAVCAVLGAAIGFYDGLVGPGTGTLLIIGYTFFAGYDMTTASGNAKVVNLASNVAALIAFVSRGNVLYALAVPATLCGIAGNWLGAGLAIRSGARFIRPMLLLVMAALIGKVIYDALA